MESDESLHQNAKQKEEQYEALEKAIEMLNEEQKTCIRMFYLRSMSYQQIADATGYSLNNVKSFIQNGKRNLKIKLMEINGTSSGIVAMALLLFELF